MKRTQFRIREYGGRWTIQVKDFFGWRDRNRYMQGDPIPFKDTYNTYEEAKAMIEDEINAELRWEAELKRLESLPPPPKVVDRFVYPPFPDKEPF